MADIEHATLPDELLHEPKGASKAVAGTVYVADGTGKGSFKKVPSTSLDFDKVTITPITPITFKNSLVIDTSQLHQGTNNTLEDIDTDALPIDVQNTINKNTAELAAMYKNIVEILTQLKTSATNNTTTTNSMIQGLKDEGFLG